MLVFVTSFEHFYVHLLPAFFWNMVFMIVYFVDVAHATKVSPVSFLNSSSNLPIGLVLFRI